MALYKRKTTVVHAEQWFPGKDVPGVVTEYDPKLDRVEGTPPYAFIRAPYSKILIDPGDWVITTQDGRHYALKPVDFERTYELMEEE